MKYNRVCLIVLDSVGIGAQPDAAQFGDEGAHTLGNIAKTVPDMRLPNLERLGLGNIAPLDHISPVDQPQAHFGKMQEVSVGKDTMTGHWEMMGLHLMEPFQVFPNGFPEELITQFEQKTGRKVLCNKPASGTEVLVEYGKQQMETGDWIVYTSADSVFQIAAHEDVIPLEELYQACQIARDLTIVEPYRVGRVIARPYVGQPGRFERTSNRHDYALKPPAPTVLDHLKAAGYDVRAIGKINDIFDGEGITHASPTRHNLDGIQQTISALKQSFSGLLFTNLVDFDSLYGHRRNPQGYAEALQQFDEWLPAIMAQIKEDDLLIITADHGNDPTFAGTDHTREYVPLLVYQPQLVEQQSLGIRLTFADIATTLADNFSVESTGNGQSFLTELK
ncbi:phosphopentomutase [Paenibacillus yanchengensis]|uniref:Phosphopentomutase n=1 Tax=Paenibacillus yanchengensis TaxID=2035833 RepID=A0ABW4YGN2_9BACL